MQQEKSSGIQTQITTTSNTTTKEFFPLGLRQEKVYMYRNSEQDGEEDIMRCRGTITMNGCKRIQARKVDMKHGGVQDELDCLVFTEDVCTQSESK